MMANSKPTPSDWKKVEEINFHPSRNLGYSAYFEREDDQSRICEDCVKNCVNDDERFMEKSNFEDFSLICDGCCNPIDCSYPPSSIQEGVKRLIEVFGWCSESAEVYTTQWFEGQKNDDN
jgi:hypothetical protein